MLVLHIMSKRWKMWVLLSCSGALGMASAGCSGDTGGARDFSGGHTVVSGGTTMGTPGGAFGTGGAVSSTGGVAAPPEMEQQSQLSLAAPQVGERLLYTVDPEDHDIVIVDAETLTVRKLSTGRLPLLVKTIPGTDDAVVVNLGSDDVTVVRPATARTELDLAAMTFPVVQGANDVVMDPSGKWAVVFFTGAQSSPEAPLGELQGVSVLQLSPGQEEAYNVAVGFRPRSVSFSADGSTAYVMTEVGISIIDLAQLSSGGVGIAPEVAFLVKTPQDASITRDGRFAVGYEAGGHVLHFVDLVAGAAASVDLVLAFPELAAAMADGAPDGGIQDAVDGGVDATADGGPDAVSEPSREVLTAITDLDLAADGSFALAVIRDSQRVVKIPLPQGVEDASKMAGWSLGGARLGQAQLLPDDSMAMLFSTALPEKQVALLSFADGAEPTLVNVRKTVRAVGIAEDGETAVIVHSRAPGDPHESGISDAQKLDRSFAYTLLRPRTGYALIRPTVVDPGAFLIVPGGEQLVLIFRNDAQGVREVHRVDLFNFQKLPIVELLHPPLAIGVVGDTGSFFVHQQYAAGSLSFIDWESGDVKNLTGYELNHNIRN